MADRCKVITPILKTVQHYFVVFCRQKVPPRTRVNNYFIEKYHNY